MLIWTDAYRRTEYLCKTRRSVLLLSSVFLARYYEITLIAHPTFLLQGETVSYVLRAYPVSTRNIETNLYIQWGMSLFFLQLNVYINHFILTSTHVLTLLTFCPPGPWLVVNENSTLSIKNKSVNKRIIWLHTCDDLQEQWRRVRGSLKRNNDEVCESMPYEITH